MVLVPVKDTRIQSAEMGDFHYRKFVEWAFVNRQTKGTFLANVGKARVVDAANAKEQLEGLEHYALLYNLTIEQVRDCIADADQNGVSTVELHDRLAKGLRGEEATKRSNRRKKSNLAKDDEPKED